MENITPLTLNEFSKKRNEITKKYGNKPKAPYMWKNIYQTYLENLEQEDPTTLAVYHDVKVSSILDGISDKLESKNLTKYAFEIDRISDFLDKI